MREVLPLKRIPSTDAMGDWLRRIGQNGGLEGLEKLNSNVIKKGMKPVESRSAASRSTWRLSTGSGSSGSEPNGLQVERHDGIKSYTLDIDATGIVAEKESAKMTYPPASAEPRDGGQVKALRAICQL